VVVVGGEGEGALALQGSSYFVIKYFLLAVIMNTVANKILELMQKVARFPCSDTRELFMYQYSSHLTLI
jgi:hypothetical protein